MALRRNRQLILVTLFLHSYIRVAVLILVTGALLATVIWTLGLGHGLIGTLGRSRG